MNDLQQKVLSLVIAGKKNGEIAEELSYSETYIKKIIKQLFDIFKAKNRIELVRESLLFLLK